VAEGEASPCAPQSSPLRGSGLLRYPLSGEFYSAQTHIHQQVMLSDTV